MSNITINVIDIGDLRRVTAEFRNDSNTLADPTDVTFIYTTPEATVTTLVYGTDIELAKSAIGSYYVDLTPDSTEAGFWSYRWVGTGAIEATETSQFYVRRSGKSAATFTYDGGDLTEELFQVRFLIGDTIAPGELSDEEINWLISTFGNVGEAAIGAARSLFIRYSREVDRQVGDLKIFYSQKAKQYKDALVSLEDSISSGSIGNNASWVYVGGMYKAEEIADSQNDSLVQPRFRAGLHDFLPQTQIDPLTA